LLANLWNARLIRSPEKAEFFVGSRFTLCYKVTLMDSAQANEQLRVIRSLMERATIYRAISAPTALVGGILSIVASVVVTDRDVDHFIEGWLLVLIITLAANTWFIRQKARREGGKIFSSGLRLAIRSALPVLLVAAVVTVVFWHNEGGKGFAVVLAAVWTVCYGLALLSTATFAPGSLVWFGWFFLLTGLLAGLILSQHIQPASHPASLLMGLSFGGYHLVYAACTWPRRSAVDAGPTSIE